MPLTPDQRSLAISALMHHAATLAGPGAFNEALRIVCDILLSPNTIHQDFILAATATQRTSRKAVQASIDAQTNATKVEIAAEIAELNLIDINIL